MRRMYFSLRVASLWIVVWLAGVPVYGQPPSSESAVNDERIRISAENLTVDSNSRYAEFSGNVRAVQGRTEIKADKLKIYYKTSEDSKTSKGTPSAGQDSIDKIVADGNVMIQFDEKIAQADQAVYTADDRVLTLSGANAKITSGTDSITGSKIVLYRTDGRIKVEGSGQKPVEAVFFPGQKGIQ